MKTVFFVKYCDVPELLQEQLLEEKYPNEVKPAEYKASTEGYDEADDETEKSALRGPGGPSYYYLGYPVYKGNDEKKKLNQSALLVEPSHAYVLLFYRLVTLYHIFRFLYTV